MNRSVKVVLYSCVRIANVTTCVESGACYGVVVAYISVGALEGVDAQPAGCLETRWNNTPPNTGRQLSQMVVNRRRRTNIEWIWKEKLQEELSRVLDRYVPGRYCGMINKRDTFCRASQWWEAACTRVGRAVEVC